MKVREIVAKAEQVRPTLNGDFRKVEKLVKDNDVVFAVWQDFSQPSGVAYTLVKGLNLLRTIMSMSNTPATVVDASWTAIPCVCAEWAFALKTVAGEPDRLN